MCGRACRPATIDKQQFRSKKFPRTLKNLVQKNGRTHLRKVHGFLSLRDCYISIVATPRKNMRPRPPQCYNRKAAILKEEMSTHLPQKRMQKSGRTHFREVRGFLSLQNCYLSIVAAPPKNTRLRPQHCYNRKAVILKKFHVPSSKAT